jgi:hypothetical protein
MSARKFTRPKIGRTYLYYTCASGAAHRPNTCPALKHHKAREIEEQVWSKVSAILKYPGAKTEHWLGEISETRRKRAATRRWPSKA